MPLGFSLHIADIISEPHICLVLTTSTSQALTYRLVKSINIICFCYCVDVVVLASLPAYKITRANHDLGLFLYGEAQPVAPQLHTF